MSDLLCAKIVGLVSKTARKRLEELMLTKKVPISRLVAIAIEHEFERDKPFDYSVDLPQDEYVDMAFADEAGKILDYMKMSGGMPLEMMVLNRHDIGIPDKERYLLAFRECLLKGFLVPYKPRQAEYSPFKYDEETVFYQVKDARKAVMKKIRREAKDYETFKKLEKKFKDK